MKKVLRIIAIALAALVAAALVLSRLAAPDYLEVRAGIADIDPHRVADGVYEGSAYLFPVSVKARVTVAEGVIRDIALLEHFNGKGKPAEAILPSILEEQSLGVDAVSGATHSSLVILKAVEDALEKGSQR